MKPNVAIVLGTVCFALTFAIGVQIKTVDNITEKEGIKINDNSELKDEVLRTRQKNKDAFNKLEKAQEELEKIRKQATENSGSDSIIETQIKRNNSLLGLTEAKGSGLIIKLDDNREVDPEKVIGDVGALLVHEGDLRQIVNELFNAGAEAISINGKRIVSTTSIACDGNIIRINDEIIGAPMEIKAIRISRSIRICTK